jgi:hypothetical protein
MIGMDKMYHFLGGLGTCLIISFVASYLGLTRPEAYGLVSAFLAGALKEFADVAIAKDWKRWDMYDFLATCAGGFAGLVVVQII